MGGWVGGCSIGWVGPASAPPAPTHTRTHARGTRTQARCLAHLPDQAILLLPLDLVGPPEGLEAAARAAWAAFGGAGVDYLVHNAGGWVGK